MDLVLIEDGIFVGEVKIVDRNNGRYEVFCILKWKGEYKFLVFVNGEEISSFFIVYVKKRFYKFLWIVGSKGSGVGEMNVLWGIVVIG